MKVLLIALLLTTALTAGCNSGHKHEDENVWYTCSMDPQVMEKKPGLCPVCKMELAKIIVDPKQNDNSIRLSKSQLELANIRVDTVQHISTADKILWRGVVVADKNNSEIVAARVPGRVDRLVFKETGKTVSRGEILYQIYSEELNAAVEDYLLTKEKAENLKNGTINYNRLVQSAFEKLRVWGLEERQIKNLTKSGKPIPFFSAVSGTIAEVNISEGDYVQTGSPVYRVEDFSRLWIEAEVYPEEIQYARKGRTTEVQIGGVPGILTGTIDFVSPVIDPSTRLIKVRIVVSNESGMIRPGMHASAYTGGAGETKLSVRSGAVLVEEDRSMLWVKKSDEDIFYPRMVKTGSSGGGFTEIREGLEKGDLYVMTGAYLLNSEYKLRHSGGMEGHQH